MGEEATADIQVRNINKRTIAAIIAFFVVGGAIPVANMVTDRDTTDRFYGYEGRRLQGVSDTHAEQLKAHALAIDNLQDEIADIRRDDEFCVERQMRFEVDVEELQRAGRALHDKVYVFQEGTNRTLDHIDKQIERCISLNH